ncbi:MAG: endonuclease III [Candidatus Nealsonbacteria bacterium]|nr:endonuclease III [Candidatus Nealsonbacteria bacterium]
MLATDLKPRNAKRHAAKVVRILRRAYPEATCSLNFSNPLELLVATILSAQCTDERVNRVTEDLFAKYGGAADYAGARLAQLERDVKSTGFFRNKAKSIKGCCEALLQRYDGKVPKTIDELIELPGVGRKTANVILGTAFGIASGVVVDTHVGRISRRLGLTRQKNPEKVEQDLMQMVPKREWIALSHWMIWHGRRACMARKPDCEQCPLESVCPRIGVETI